MDQVPTDEQLRGLRVVVMGLGCFGGGIGVTRFLAERGARVLVTDQADPARLRASVESLADLPLEWRLGVHDETDLDDADLLVVNPAVDRRRSTFFKAAATRGVPHTTEINLFLARCPARVIGVTGSVGKSTTCAMVHAIVEAPAAREAAGFGEVHLGGNIGRSLLEAVDGMTPRDVVVLELSSFQLETFDQLPSGPPIAGLTNILPHHLQRHGDVESYLCAKLNLFRRQPPGGTAVVGSVDADVRRNVERLAAERGCSFVDLSDADESHDLQIPGSHNQANARMAAALARAVGAPDDTVSAALQGFAGLAHRLAFVGEVAGVRYYNDSKATSPAAVLTALDALDGPIVLLCGGKDIGPEVDELAVGVRRRVRAAICFGEVSRRLAGLIRAKEGGQAPDVLRTHTMPEAVDMAREISSSGDVVLLSPGCPSYDEFVNYQERGDAFTSIVQGWR